MKTITVYRAEDGTRFDEAEKCRLYESQGDRIGAAMSVLKPTPKGDGCNFTNGGGYIAQEKNNVLAAYEAMLEIAAEVVGKEVVSKARAAYAFAPSSIIAQYIHDSGHEALCRAWLRLQCMDFKWREWGQRFYAANPEEGKQIDLSA